ncbi:sulfite exporter TauE/SafE family protein [Neisseria chenwenguii]|uniref:Probable membrane transporter protein n=1 Tax=Neisseria chenwenguii TaxID=1853278 RepID=A0A220S000_9NEIS|nr:sulfite exporter TauE/SafE family protein [Neisseria chenwenguii]ASK26784.1 hypothetical protein BG910_02640 [Neisseria chenwenguii]ROV53870.1 sulfite exporter TauE/SafE family protein [Neisseria chenwenguii]
MDYLTMIAALLAAGGAAGFLAGLFGVGGGTIIVPIVLWVLQLQNAGGHPYAQHLAIGTSFAVMVFTTLSSVYAQHKKRSIDWQTVLRMSPGMIAGVLLGAVSAKFIPTYGLQIFFIVFLLAIAIKTLTGANPKPSRRLPRTGGLTAVGIVFGTASSWVGIGGGSLSVPFLMYCNMEAHKAIGTSSGLAWPIAVAGTTGYLVMGWNVSDLPAGSLGFLYLPAVAVLSIATVACAPLGVKTAHKLPAKKLKTAFGILLLLIALNMALKL